MLSVDFKNEFKESLIRFLKAFGREIFPSHWTELLPVLVKMIADGQRLFGLEIISEITMKYRNIVIADQLVRRDMEYILSMTEDILREGIKKIDCQEQLMEVYFSIKTVLNLSHIDIPEFIEEDNLVYADLICYLMKVDLPFDVSFLKRELLDLIILFTNSYEYLFEDKSKLLRAVSYYCKNEVIKNSDISKIFLFVFSIISEETAKLLEIMVHALSCIDERSIGIDEMSFYSKTIELRLYDNFQNTLKNIETNSQIITNEIQDAYNDDQTPNQATLFFLLDQMKCSLELEEIYSYFHYNNEHLDNYVNSIFGISMFISFYKYFPPVIKNEIYLYSYEQALICPSICSLICFLTYFQKNKESHIENILQKILENIDILYTESQENILIRILSLFLKDFYQNEFPFPNIIHDITEKRLQSKKFQTQSDWYLFIRLLKNGAIFSSSSITLALDLMMSDLKNEEIIEEELEVLFQLIFL